MAAVGLLKKISQLGMWPLKTACQHRLAYRGFSLHVKFAAFVLLCLGGTWPYGKTRVWLRAGLMIHND